MNIFMAIGFSVLAASVKGLSLTAMWFGEDSLLQ